MKIIFQSALCGEGEEKDDKGKKHHEKIKKCMKETEDLKKCCPYPKKEDIKDDPKCKHHIEGIEDMEKKEQHKAYKCFAECWFEEKGLIEDGELVKEKIHEETNKMLVELEGEDFQLISTESIDYCLDECEKIDFIFLKILYT